MDSTKRYKLEPSPLSVLPSQLMDEIYDYSSSATFSCLALVSRGILASSSGYRRSDRYALRLMPRALDRQIDKYIRKWRPSRKSRKQYIFDNVWMIRRITRVLIRTVLYEAVVPAEESPGYTDQAIIRAARYCATGSSSLELLWWAAQREGDAHSISLFRDSCPEPSADAKQQIAKLESDPLYVEGPEIEKYVQSSPQAAWTILRYVERSKKYIFDDVFDMMTTELRHEKLFGVSPEFECAVLGISAMLDIFWDWAESPTGEFNAGIEIREIAECIGAPIEYSEELMAAAIGKK